MAPSLPVGMRRAPPCVVCSKSCQQRRNISVSVPPTIFKFPKTVAREVGAVHPPGHCRGLGAGGGGNIVAVDSEVGHGVYRVPVGAAMIGRGRRSVLVVLVVASLRYAASVAGGGGASLLGVGGRWMLSNDFPPRGGVRSISGRPALHKRSKVAIGFGVATLVSGCCGSPRYGVASRAPWVRT